MQTFGHSVGTRMIGCGTNAVNADECAKIAEKIRFKLRTAIPCNGRWNPKDGDPLRNENASDSFGCDIRNRHVGRQTGKTINECKEILKTI